MLVLLAASGDPNHSPLVDAVTDHLNELHLTLLHTRASLENKITSRQCHSVTHVPKFIKHTEIFGLL